MRFFLLNILILICFLFCATNACAQTTYDWTGAVSTDWSNPANWESTTSGVTTNPAATYPGSADAARIGVLPLTTTSNFPVISSGGATSVGSVVWGTENYLNVSLVVNTTFTVNGSVNNTSAVSGNGAVSAYVFSLSGTGTFIVTGNLNIGYDDGFATSNPGNNNSFAFNSTINFLNIYGNVYLNIFQGDTHHRGFVPQLNILGGTVSTTSVQSFLTNSTTVNTLLTAGLAVGNASGSPTATLQLTGANALPSFSPYVTNTITFNNPGATVEYSGTTSQTVYTDTSIPNLSNTISYYSIKFSGTGVKTALPGNLNIAGDFTNTMANDACGCNSVSLSAPLVNFNGTTQSLYGGGGTGTTFYNVDFSNSGTKSMLSGSFNLASTGILTMIGSSTSLAAGNGIFTLLSDVSSTATIAALPLGTSITGTVNVQRFIQGSSGSIVKRGYRLISSTVYTATVGGVHVFDIKYLLNSVLVSGLNGSANGFNDTPLNNSSIYLFREDDPPPPTSGTIFRTQYNWKGIAKINNTNAYDIGTQKKLTTTNLADTTTTIPVGNGALFFFRGDNVHNLINKTALPFAYPEDVTTTQVGQLNTGTINVKLWFANATNNLGNNLSYTFANTPGPSGSTSALTGGYTLVGNPYASTINWEKYNRNSTITKSSIYGGGGLGSTIWIFNEASKQYYPYMQKTSISSVADTTTSVNPGTSVGSSSNMIASGQGFFIKATVVNSQTLSFRETAKTSTQPTAANLHNLMSTPGAGPKEFALQPEPLFRLQLVTDSVNTDEIVIRMNKQASTKFVDGEDAEDLGGSSALESLSAFSSDSVELAINYLPFPGKQQMVVPLLVNATASGTYQLINTQLDNLQPVYQIYLKDAFTKDSLLMKAGATYSFTMDKSNPATFGRNRFSIVIGQDTAFAYKLLNFTASKMLTARQVQLVWKTANEQNYTNFTVERSTDTGKTFTVLGGLQGTGAGLYSLLDQAPVIGQNLYRLKQEDLNNTITYSKVIPITYSLSDNAQAKISVYPNPTANFINLAINPNLKVAAYSIRIINSS
ncbi:MAG: hypothetical protein JWQ66_1150, partial [Mucilaginibacter sp.]|nr:hypothetical protein [Mucilaginibacter sp.]